MIVAKNISKSYPEGIGKRLEVLRDLDISVRCGEMIAITGESGVGKSTLLHLLGLLDKPDTGEIFIEGVSTRTLSDNAIAKIRNEKIGFVFQFHYLLPEFTAVENVAIPARVAGVSAGTAMKKAEELLEYVGLAERAGHYPNALSGGEQQRVALTRALICEPKILLADEPTGNLDEKNAERLIEILFDLAYKKNLAVVIATHNRELAIKTNKIYKLYGGKIHEIIQS